MPKILNSTPFPSPLQGLVRELSERGCLLGPDEAPAKCGVEERAVSLEAIGALNTALEAVPDYNQPTLLHAVRSVARGPGGEPVRLAEILSPRHVGRPTAFISHMYGACHCPCCTSYIAARSLSNDLSVARSPDPMP